MKSIALRLAWIAVIGGMVGAAEAGANADDGSKAPLVLATESYPPLSYLDGDGTFRGAYIDQVETIMRDAGIPYTLEILPWARALTLAESQSRHCVFTTARTVEREYRFKWVTPLDIGRSVLVHLVGSHARPTTIDEAKAYPIGTHRGDYTEDLIRRAGFPDLDLSADFDATLRKLLDRRIDLMPMQQPVFERLVKAGVKIEMVMPFAQQQMGIACHTDVSDAEIARMQTSLERMMKDGREEWIYQRYGLTRNR